MKIGKYSLIFSLILALSTAAMSQAQAPKLNPAGTWAGTAENQGSYDNITITIEKKGDAYTGKVKDELGMFADVEIKDFAWKGDKITFEFPGNMGGMAFNLKVELTLTETAMNGTWTMIEDGSSGAVALTKK